MNADAAIDNAIAAAAVAAAAGNNDADADARLAVLDDVSLASADDDEEVAAAPSLQSFVEDDSNVPPSKRMAYMMMLCLRNIEGFNPQEDHPYSEFFNRNGFKSRFKPTKAMIVQELKRRDRDARPNTSNNTVEMLMRRIDPFEDGADKEYVTRMEGEYRQQLLNQLQQESEEAGNAVPRFQMRPDDRLRVALMFDIDDIYEAYMRSQDCLNRMEIDAGMSGAGADFHAMAVEQLNDREWVPECEAAPTLHSDFAYRRAVPRGDFEWTPEKLKKYIGDVRRNLSDMIRRYEISGNGSNQATHDDGDNEDAIESEEETWGRFNAERARRVAERRGEQDVETSGGDDRANFLRHLPVDWLYTWHAFDQRGLLHFTCVRLAQGQAANSHESPAPTARPRSNRLNDQMARNQREMLTSVQDIGDSIAEFGRAAKIRRLDQLDRELVDATVARDEATTEAGRATYEAYVARLNRRLDALETEVYGRGSVEARGASAASGTNN
ncbi:hypothetical protein ACHAXT_001298 [Thalassiosira profunda]